MTDQERNIVLKMIEDGKITPEEGLSLMQALKPTAEDLLPAQTGSPKASETPAEESAPKESTPNEDSHFENDPRIERIKSTARRLWQIPLWIGVGTISLSAIVMYFSLANHGLNFWFFCLWLPLLLGILIVALAVGTRNARWLFVNVEQKPGEKPQRIFLGFPIPLKLTAWALRTFGHKIPDMDKAKMSGIAQMVETGLTGDEPLIVNVDEGDDGERVQVYIG